MSYSTDLDILISNTTSLLGTLTALHNAGVKYMNDGESVEIQINDTTQALVRLRKLRVALPGRATLNVDKAFY